MSGLQPNLTKHVSRRSLLQGAALMAGAIAVPPVISACGNSTHPSNGAQTGAVSLADIPLLNVGNPIPTIISFDVAKAFENEILSISLNAIETLVTYQNLQLTPLLATSWTYSPENLRYEFVIREGVRFWDGTVLRPSDVVASLARNLDPALASQIQPYYVNVAAITAQGNTVIVHLKRPDPVFIDIIPSSLIMPADFMEKLGSRLGQTGSPVTVMGTGPYIISDFSNDTSATLTRNENYWGQKGYVEKAVFQCISNDQTIALAMRNGSIDITFQVSQQIGKQFATSGVDVIAAPGMDCSFTAFNLAARPWSDIHVRRAVAYASDRQGFAKAFWGGYATPATGLVTPAQWSPLLSSTQVLSDYASFEQYPFDVTRAKQELAQSEFASGFSAEVKVPSNLPAIVDTYESLSQTLSTLGIHLTVTNVTQTAWYDTWDGSKSDLGMSAILFSPDYVDPADWINIIYPRSAIPAPGYNMASFDDPQVESLIERAGAATSNTARAASLMEIMKINQEQLPYFPLCWVSDVYAIRTNYRLLGEYNAMTFPGSAWLPSVRKVS